ncbi:hypothetical protein Y10_13150 [Neptunitalea sp. Y10]|uniref:Uncharacterized protein n=1 Tax=Neptunitalea lumnitzerae TaxID=2965509 RepID=A0ABQ5MHS7_9FLAO|nr:hypothetical protein Y10_13150 [Neptunitalea sp. Y10]
MQLNKFDYGILFIQSIENLKNQLSTLLPKVNDDGELWIAFPSESSVVATDINMNYNWKALRNECFEIVDEKQINKNWKAKRFRKLEYTKWKELSRIA